MMYFCQLKGMQHSKLACEKGAKPLNPKTPYRETTDVIDLKTFRLQGSRVPFVNKRYTKMVLFCQ